MSRISIPELKKYMDKRVNVQLNANRRISGIVRGFDAFMNVVLDETVEHRQQQPSTNDASKHPNAVEKSIGMVVIRGNSIVMLEALDRLE